ncbi:uncharacterized protein BJ171DRAFT_401416, partial [Polychytrium aggregatum]|uniref:uncharacterized protein n=1 Tax=Polychytrium aggregatum TaxID=110093 RepID=UPI0022FEEA33
DDSDTIQCLRCRTWGHLCCFGFRSRDDPRIPKDHYCFKCVDALKGRSNWPGAHRNAIFRRCLNVVLEEGMEGVQWLASRLG